MSFEAGAALVTGGSRRLGKAMAIALARRGLDVAIQYLNSRSEAESTAEEIRKIGRRAAAIRTDLALERETGRLVERAARELRSPLSVLVNNASAFERDHLLTASRASWDLHMEINLRAPYLLTQDFARQAPSCGASGGEPVASAVVVNMVDQRVLRPTSEFSTYTVSKMSLWDFTRTAALALAPEVRVNAIGPGPTLPSAKQEEDHFARQRSRSILQRGANPEDIALALNYILDAPALTGQLLCLDGGQHLAWKASASAV
ncbi:MAG: SDR family oxidoreductase [Albidovulum sp.]|nr:SDR family oxidoreductase [Albidovulum sp.]